MLHKVLWYLFSRLIPLIWAIPLTMGITPLAWSQSALSPTWATQVSINIPSQPLAQALNAWAQQTRLELIVQPALVTGKTASALSGNMTPHQALDRLLAGSGLVATMDGSTAMIKTTAAAGTQQLPEMRVSADALKQGTAEEGYLVSNVSGVGLWDERSLRDTPYSISVVPSDLIENVNAQNMGQIFKMNPLTQEPVIQNPMVHPWLLYVDFSQPIRFTMAYLWLIQMVLLYPSSRSTALKFSVGHRVFCMAVAEWAEL